MTMAFNGYSQTCPGQVVGVGTATALTCAEAEFSAREAAILDADAKCPDNCMFTFIPDSEDSHNPVSVNDSCTAKVETIHKCVSRNDDETEPVPNPPGPTISIPIKILAGVGVVLLGIVTVIAAATPIPGDEVVVGAGAASLAGVVLSGT